MDSLVQRIKNLDQNTFQQLCFQLMSLRFPGAKIRYPEGVAGDEGADFFLGDLTRGPTVWQSKAFQVTVIGDSQKAQIRTSLRDAFRKLGPRLWILCLNMNLDIKAARWFKRLQDAYRKRGVLVADPFEGLDVARELLFRRTLRRDCFPNLELSGSEIKEIIKAAARGSEGIDLSTLETLATNEVEEWLDRLRDEDDARFTFEVTFGGDRGPSVFPPPPEPGLVSAMTDGRKVVMAFARDLEALALDPVSSEIQFTGTGKEKLLDFVRTGRNQKWEPSEILAFKSSVPLLKRIKFEPGNLTLALNSSPDPRNVPLKLTFRASDASVTYDYVEFRRTRAGTEEAEIKTNERTALGLSLVLPKDPRRAGNISLSTNVPGSDVHDVAKLCETLKLLEKGCELELFDLRSSATVGTLKLEQFPLPFSEWFFNFVDDLEKIAKAFNATFRLPGLSGFDSDDEDTFLILRAFALSKPLKLKNYSLSVTKSKENAESIPGQFQEEMVFRLEHDAPAATLFGAQISLGKTIIRIDRARVEKLSETLQKFKRAKIGEVVKFSVRPLVPVHFLLAREG